MKINIRGEELTLLPQKALLWERKNLLALSDIHLGKAESFQSMGVPVPSQVNIEDLTEIATLIERHKIREVLILGDLIHHKTSWTEDLFITLDTFLEFHNFVEFRLILGNHEKGSIEFLKELPIELVWDDFSIDAFTFVHGHEVSPSDFAIQGHIHPVVVLKDGPTRMRLPCFVLNENSLTLPSFGSFTGGHEVHLQANQRIFAVTQKVTEIG